jgi:hypothetical protein
VLGVGSSLDPLPLHRNAVLRPGEQLNRCTRAMIVQLAQNVACDRIHAAAERAARWTGRASGRSLVDRVKTRDSPWRHGPWALRRSSTSPTWTGAVGPGDAGREGVPRAF